MIYSADEAVSAATITLGVIGVVLAIPAFALFLYGAYRIFRLISATKHSEKARNATSPERTSSP